MDKFDFSGWATRNNIRCSDGRTILQDAFKNNDGARVPLVWNHQHDGPDNVLGHAVLENRSEGVYAYCTFNDTERAQDAKLLVKHGDITALSIWANKLKQKGENVLHGAIREVSLVLAGANPGAYIDSIMVHGEEQDQAFIYTDEEIVVGNHIRHSNDEPDKTEDPKKEDLKKDGSIEKGEKNMAEERTVADVIESMTEEQKNVLYALVGQALEDGGIDPDDDEGGEGENMKHNVFDYEENLEGGVLSHAEMDTIIKDAKRTGSLRESFMSHADDYGIENIDYLFPDAKAVSEYPEFIKREDTWVQKVINGTHHSPFSRIKSLFADITADEARAKGYIKGNMKKEEVFTLLKRTTTPTTIYKKQKLDRDDAVDIVDFDVIAWMKSEMRMMLDEEIARAALIGDGRLSSSDDHIDENHIRPIWKDEALYTVRSVVNLSAASTEDDKAKAFIKNAIKARKNYKGSGNPTLFTTEDVVTDCLLLEDNIGRRMYNTTTDLATTLRVKEIVTVEPMENCSRTENGNTYDLMGIIVNLADYNIGADKGGSVNMFDDFDIDYNQMKYLIETRCSGALVKPFSAIAIESTVASSGTGGE